MNILSYKERSKSRLAGIFNKKLPFHVEKDKREDTI